MQNNPLPSVSIADIRAVYQHLPAEAPGTGHMRHPAILVFVHDPEDVANSSGQSFLAQNNDPTGRLRQPLAVAAEMTQADYKIFDLTPPERLSLPCQDRDLALALSYGMVTIEQGVDFVALFAVGDSSDAYKDRINNFDDIATYGALNVAAAFGAFLAASMAQIPVIAPAPLIDCLNRIAESEGITDTNLQPIEGALTEVALEIVRRKAIAAM